MVRISIAPDDPDTETIALAADVLKRGGVVAYPTDTLYGLAVDPRRGGAAARLFALKGRDATAAVPLIAASIEQVRDVAIVGEHELRLARVFWPGPLTIVMPARPGIARALLGGGTSVAVRIPSHAVARALADTLGFCITATSANRSGQAPAVTATAVAEAFKAAQGSDEALDFLLDAGTVVGGLASTIVEIAATGPRLVRTGAVAWDRVLESLE